MKLIVMLLTHCHSFCLFVCCRAVNSSKQSSNHRIIESSFLLPLFHLFFSRPIILFVSTFYRFVMHLSVCSHIYLFCLFFFLNCWNDTAGRKKNLSSLSLLWKGPKVNQTFIPKNTRRSNYIFIDLGYCIRLWHIKMIRLSIQLMYDPYVQMCNGFEIFEFFHIFWNNQQQRNKNPSTWFMFWRFKIKKNYVHLRNTWQIFHPIS